MLVRHDTLQLHSLIKRLAWLTLSKQCFTCSRTWKNIAMLGCVKQSLSAASGKHH